MNEPIKTWQSRWAELSEAYKRLASRPDCMFAEIAELRARVAELELMKSGRPVAWMRPSVDGYDAAYRDASAVAASKATGATHWDDNGWIPLYTSPARQPMTDEEIELCYFIALRSFQRHKAGVRGQMVCAADDPNTHFARAVETFHQIKGVK